MTRSALPVNDLSLDERTALVESCRAWACRIALGYRGGALTWEELEAAALGGLAKAARHFDPGRGIAFVTYCTLWVRKAIQLEQRFHRRWGFQCVPDGFRANRVTNPDVKDGELDIPDLLVARTDDPHADAARGEWWERAMRFLTPHERFVIGLRFDDGLTLAEAGRLVGVSRTRIYQVEKRALERLRRAINDEQLAVG